MKGKERSWDTFVSYSNLKSPPNRAIDHLKKFTQIRKEKL